MYLGLDIGASYCKAVLVNSEERVVSSERTRMPPFKRSNSKTSTIYEVDIHKITDIVISLTKRIAQKATYIDAIGISGQMHGILFVDKERVPLSDFVSWQDQRTTETMLDEQLSYLDYLAQRLSNCRAVTGSALRSGMLGPLIFWWKTNGYIDQKHHKVSFLSDYLGSLLTNTEIVCDPTQASGSGVYNLIDKRWLEEFLEVAQVSEDLLPDVVETGTIIGGISNSIASSVGITQGTPVCVSTGDYQAALFASGIDTNHLSINIGTGAQVSLLTITPDFSDIYETRPFFDGYYTKCIPGLPGGRAIALFESFVDRTVRMFSDHLGQYEILGSLDEACAQHFRKTDMVCDPHFFDFGNGFYKPGFSQIGYHNFRIEEMYQALLESLVRAYHEAFDVLRSAGSQPKDIEIILSGGVAQKSSLLPRVLEGVFGFPVTVPKYEEDAAIGAARVAMKYG